MNGSLFAAENKILSRPAAVYEGEHFTEQSGCSVETVHFPYIGEGYLHMKGSASYAEWNNVEADADGKYTLIIKYANASGTDLPCDLKVNGIPTGVLPFPSVYSKWTRYWNARVTVDLKKGSNTIRLTANTDKGGPNIDNIAISPDGLSEPREPIFDVRDYGAVGDGITMNTRAIQDAIDACEGTNGTVVIPKGIFLSGQLLLKSDMTFWISEGAILRGSPYKADYPEFRPDPDSRVNWPDKKGELGRGFICSHKANNLIITGGGKIDGNARQGEDPEGPMNDCATGDHNGTSTTRPALIYLALGRKNIQLKNIDAVNGACWGIALVECDNVTIDGINERNDFASNGDGIDIVDSHNVTITNSSILSVDDAIVPKSCVARGVVNLTVQNASLVTNCGGIKLGTDSYGCFKNITATDVAMEIPTWTNSNAALEFLSCDGADIDNIRYSNFNITGFPNFVFILNGANIRGTTPIGKETKTGKVCNILIENVDCRNIVHDTGSIISGTVLDGKTYPVENVHFRNVKVENKGGLTYLPDHPEEYGGRYPKGSVFGTSPSWGYYIRHAGSITFTDCSQTVSDKDARPAVVKYDTTDVTFDGKEYPI